MDEFRKRDSVDPSKDADSIDFRRKQTVEEVTAKIDRCERLEFHESNGVVFFYCSQTGVSGAFLKAGNKALVEKLKPAKKPAKSKAPSTANDQTPQDKA